MPVVYSVYVLYVNLLRIYNVVHAGLAGTGAASGIGISAFELSVRY
jgi:hypothetical protein